MDDTPEERSLDPFEIYANQGFQVRTETSQVEGTWTSQIVKDEKPLIDIELNRKNDLKVKIRSEVDISEAEGYIKGYFADNEIPTFHEYSRDDMGRRVYRSVKPGVSFAVTESLGDEKMVQVEITIQHGMMLAPKADQQEAFLQQKFRPMASIVGVLEKETPALLINNAFANAIIAIMSPRLL